MLQARQGMRPWGHGLGSYGCVRRYRRCFEVTSSLAHVVLCVMPLRPIADALLTPSRPLPMRLTPLSVLSMRRFQAARPPCDVQRKENSIACKSRVNWDSNKTRPGSLHITLSLVHRRGKAANANSPGG